MNRNSRIYVIISKLIFFSVYFNQCFCEYYKILNYKILDRSLEDLISKVYSNKTEDLAILKKFIGTPWEGSEIAKVYFNYTSSYKDKGNFGNLFKNDRFILGKYRRMEIKYPLGSKKKLIAMQNCQSGKTVLINYSPMKMKTEFSIYLPFGSNLDPNKDQGLTYLTGFILLNMGSELDNYLINFEEYVEKQKDNSLTSVTVTNSYTKLTVIITDERATETLIRFMSSVGFISNKSEKAKTSDFNNNNNLFEDEDKVFLDDKKIITTDILVNSLCRLYHIYRSCLRDEDYRIDYIKTSFKIKKSTSDSSNINNDRISSYFSNCGIFSTYWVDHLSQMFINSCSSYRNISNQELTKDIKEWLYQLKLLIKEYYNKYWTPERMSLYIDSSLFTSVFEDILNKKLAITSSECNNESFFLENDEFLKYFEKKQINGTIDDINNNYFEIVEEQKEFIKEPVLKILNIVPLSYKLSILDLDFKIKLKNMTQMISISLTRVMDVVTAIYRNSFMKKQLKNELNLINDLNLYWKVNYASLSLKLLFRFKLNRLDLNDIKKIIEDFHSYSIFILKQFDNSSNKSSNEKFIISEEIFNIVDEIQRLSEMNWYNQYLFEDESTLLTTPINKCGIPNQITQHYNEAESNWIKNEIRIYNPMLFKNFPHLILTSIHRSHIRLPKECQIFNTTNCHMFRSDDQNEIKKGNTTEDTGNIVFILLEFIIRNIVEFNSTIILTDPYYRYKTDFVLNVKAYNFHEYMNLQFNSYYLKNDLFKEELVSNYVNDNNWKLPNKIINFEDYIKIPIINKNDNLNDYHRNLINPRIVFRNKLAITIDLKNLEIYSPVIFFRSILKTTLNVCNIFKDKKYCDDQDITKKHSGLVLMNILTEIFNYSIERFWESESIPGYKNILIKLSHFNGKYNNWRIPRTVSKPLHFASFSLNRNEIELNFVGPSCSIINHIRFLFDELNSRFRPFEMFEFYKLLRIIMKNEIKARKNRSTMDFIRYYQGIIQYEEFFEDEIFIYTGISITYEDYITFHNYIIETFLNKHSKYERQVGFIESVILGVVDNSIHKEYTELILSKLFFKESKSYKDVCLLQEPYFAFSIEEEPLIIRQALSDGIMTTSSASIRFQLPCTKKSSTYIDSILSKTDIFFENKNEFYWESNDNVQPRCIFNSVASRVLERILRKYFSVVIKNLVQELVLKSSKYPFHNKMNFNIRGEVEASFHKLNSIPQFTFYLLSSNFDSFTLLSILRSCINKLKTDIIENPNVLSDSFFASIKSYFIKYYCSKEIVQISKIRISLLEMSKWRYNFNWKFESCIILRFIKKKDIIDMYNDYFVSEAPYRRSLILLVQAPPFKQLISYSKDSLKNSISKMFHEYLVSLLGQRGRHNYYQEIKEKVDHIRMINRYSYPYELHNDIGILTYKHNKLKRYQPRCSKFIMESNNTHI